MMNEAKKELFDEAKKIHINLIKSYLFDRKRILDELARVNIRLDELESLKTGDLLDKYWDEVRRRYQLAKEPF